MSTLSQGHTASRLPNAPLPTIPASRAPTVPNSPTRARSTGDLLSEHEKSRTRDWQIDKDGTFNGIGRSNSNAIPTQKIPPPSAEVVDVVVDPPSKKDSKEKDVSSRPWATLDELLDKLLFLAVSGDGMQGYCTAKTFFNSQSQTQHISHTFCSLTGGLQARGASFWPCNCGYVNWTSLLAILCSLALPK